MNKNLLLLLIFLEVIIIFYISSSLLQRAGVLGVSSRILREADYPVNIKSNLKYYYEPTPNNTILHNEDWLAEYGRETINSDTLNDRFNYSVSKPQNVYRIITLGDSFTYGSFVNTEDNWSEKLEDFLNHISCNKKFEVINMGVPGYDMEYPVERFRLRGSKYKPDLVIWLVLNHDLDNINEHMRPLLEEYKQKQGINLNSSIDDITKFYDYSAKIGDEMRKQLGETAVRDYQKKALSNLNLYYKNPLIIFSIGMDRENTEELNGQHEGVIRDFMKSKPESHFIKNLSYLKNDNLLKDGHPNKKGHQMIAEDLFNYLTKNHIVPCN